MPKKGKVNIPRSDQQVQQRAESQTQEGKDGISSVVSATKDGKICLKILAKPGAKQSNVTGKGASERGCCTKQSEGWVVSVMKLIPDTLVGVYVVRTFQVSRPETYNI